MNEDSQRCRDGRPGRHGECHGGVGVGRGFRIRIRMMCMMRRDDDDDGVERERSPKQISNFMGQREERLTLLAESSFLLSASDTLCRPLHSLVSTYHDGDDPCDNG